MGVMGVIFVLYKQTVWVKCLLNEVLCFSDILVILIKGIFSYEIRYLRDSVLNFT